MNIFPIEIYYEILNFQSYEDMVLSGSVHVMDLSRALKRQYGTYSFVDYVNMMIRRHKVFYLPLTIYDKIKDKLILGHESFIHLTPDLLEAYKDKWDWDVLSENPSLTSELIEKYKDKLDVQ